MWKHKTIAFLFACGLVISFIFFKEDLVLICTALALGFSLILFFGVSQIRFNYFVTSINSGKKGISLTFDDGPDPVSTPKILEILKKHDIKAAFFLIGHKVDTYPEITQNINREGHIIGNHSYTHKKNLASKSTTFLVNEFARCQASLNTTIGRKPKFVRIPFGLANPNYYKALKKGGFISIGWNLRSFDTMYKDSNKLKAKLKKKIKPNSIVLLHDSNLVTLDVLEEFILHCKENGMTFVSLDKNINENAYQ